MFGRPKPQTKGNPIPKVHAFTYIATRLFNQDNLGRVALPRPYTVPLTNIAGSAGILYRRQFEAFQPAIAYAGQTKLTNSPAGNAGNSPLSSTTSLSPLVDQPTQQFSNTGAIGA